MNPFDTTLSEIRNGPSGGGIGAFFDFDGTIIEGYSAVAFYRHRMRHFEIGPDEAARTLLAALRSTMTEEKLEPMRSAACATWPA
jgi:putative phosphoserine phosphatase/1-acylglycerol-3-phosphate O-acyltransferase